MSNTNTLDSLNILLNAPSKAAVEQLINVVFLTRHQAIVAIPEDSQKIDDSHQQAFDPVKKIREIMDLDASVKDQDIVQLRKALLSCIEATLISGAIEDLAALFEEKGQSVNPKLKQLIGQIISNRLDTWKEASSLNRISLPKLQEFDWSLNFQRASSEIAEIQIPSVLMSLQVEDIPESTINLPKNQTINFELSREALETMIDGLGKIRDQLKNMK